MSAHHSQSGKTPISRFSPRTPESIEALGISENLVLDLVVRRLLLEGTSTLSALAKKLRVSVPVIDHIFQYMRKQQLVDADQTNRAHLPGGFFASLANHRIDQRFAGVEMPGGLVEHSATIDPFFDQQVASAVRNDSSHSDTR